MPAIETRLTDSLRRIYPQTRPVDLPRLGRVTIARNGIASFQVCVRNAALGGPRLGKVSDRLSALGARLSVLDVPASLDVRIRRVGMVPMRHHNTDTPAEELEGLGHVPGLVPDPLYPEPTLTLGPLETGAFWVSLQAGADAAPGPHVLTMRLTTEDGTERTLDVPIVVHPLVLESLQGFPITHWFYADALCDYYGVRPFSPAFWPIAERHMHNLAAHYGTCQYVPLFTPPTDGVKRPTQLLGVRPNADGSYTFDFTRTRRWVRMARRCGAQYFEWTHFFTQWGVEHAIRVYRSNADESSLLWPPETQACSPVYRRFLEQLLPALRQFLEAEGILERSFFHVSDEPGPDHLENYRAAREMLRELAPWMRVSDALSHLEYGRLGLTDIPIPSIHAAQAYADAGIPAWTYFCCGPRGRYLNRLMDTPLAKIRMAGRLLHSLGAQGFLHWGYNYWYRSQTRELLDPFAEQAGGAWPGWAYGDPFVVYPGPDGPLDSIRWEVWAEAMQDLAILRQTGTEADDPAFADIRDYGDFDWRSPTSLLAEERSPTAGEDACDACWSPALA
jgi:hypothetical protein